LSKNLKKEELYAGLFRSIEKEFGYRTEDDWRNQNPMALVVHILQCLKNEDGEEVLKKFPPEAANLIKRRLKCQEKASLD